MKKTLKRTCSLLLISILVMLLFTACGGQSAPEGSSPQETAAIQFLEALKNASEEALNEDLSFIEDMQTFSASLCETLGASMDELPDEAVKALEELQQKMINDYVASYEIKDVSEEDGSATIKCSVDYGYDTEAISNSSYATEISNRMTEYVQENMDELSKIMTEEGDEAVTKKIVSDMLPEIANSLMEAIENTGGKSEDVTIKVEKQNDKWLVTEARIEE